MRCLVAAALCLLGYTATHHPLAASPPRTAIHWARLSGAPFTLTALTLNGKSISLTERAKPTIAFGADSSVSGRGGVNSYSVGAELVAPNIIRWGVAGPVVTRMAGSAAAMQMEDQYFQALTKCDRVVLRGRQLILSNADGSTRLKFSR